MEHLTPLAQHVTSGEKNDKVHLSTNKVINNGGDNPFQKTTLLQTIRSTADSLASRGGGNLAFVAAGDTTYNCKADICYVFNFFGGERYGDGLAQDRRRVG